MSAVCVILDTETMLPYRHIIILLTCFLLAAYAKGQEVIGPVVSSGDTLLLNVADTDAIAQLLRAVHPTDKTDPDSTLPIYRQTAILSSKLNFARGVLLSQTYAAAIYAEQGKYKEAIASYQAAILICYEHKEFDGYLPGIYNGLACVYQYTYDYGSAAKYLFKACFEGHKPNADFSYAGVYNNLGLMLSRVGRPRQSLTYLDQAAALAQHDKEQQLLVPGIWLNKGTIYEDMQQPDSAIYCLETALALARQNNLNTIKKIALINLGNIYMTHDSNTKALGYFTEAYEIKGRINPVYANAGNAMLGGCYCALGQYDKGFPLLVAAREEAAQLGLTQNLMNINRLLSECYEMKSDYKQAFVYNKAYTRIKDSVEGKNRDEMVNQYEVKYRTAEKSKQLAEKELYITMQDAYLKRKNMIIGGVCIAALLLVVTTASLYRGYKHKETAQAQQIQLLQQKQEIAQFKALMEGEEKERSRIARELHDGLGGMMAAVKMNYSVLESRYEAMAATNPDINREDFDEIGDMLDEVNTELRRTAYNLMPDILSMHGIVEALKMYIDPINTYKQLYVNLQINGVPEITDKLFELSLYRIIQELIQNIIKHAEATNTLVQLNFTEDNITLLVKDNGKGFDVGNAHSGLGLQNVRSRVQSFGGTMQITSSELKGTNVLIQFDRAGNNITS